MRFIKTLRNMGEAASQVGAVGGVAGGVRRCTACMREAIGVGYGLGDNLCRSEKAVPVPLMRAATCAAAEAWACAIIAAVLGPVCEGAGQGLTATKGPLAFVSRTERPLELASTELLWFGSRPEHMEAGVIGTEGACKDFAGRVLLKLSPLPMGRIAEPPPVSVVITDVPARGLPRGGEDSLRTCGLTTTERARCPESSPLASSS